MSTSKFNLQDVNKSNYNMKSASLMLASAVNAIAPFVKGYFKVDMEIGNNMMASVGGVADPEPQIATWRVWTIDDDDNEINVEGARIDTELIDELLKY